MKRFVLALACLLSLVACVSFVAAKPASAVHDAGAIDAAHRVGVSFQGAAVDAGTIGANGLLNFTLATPQNMPFGDPQVTTIEVRTVTMDLVAGQVYVSYGIAGDTSSPPRQRMVTMNLSAANETAFVGAVKNAIAAQLGTTFQ